MARLKDMPEYIDLSEDIKFPEDIELNVNNIADFNNLIQEINSLQGEYESKFKKFLSGNSLNYKDKQGFYISIEGSNNSIKIIKSFKKDKKIYVLSNNEGLFNLDLKSSLFLDLYVEEPYSITLKPEEVAKELDRIRKRVNEYKYRKQNKKRIDEDKRLKILESADEYANLDKDFDDIMA